jgi:hypothetical protein
VRPRGGSRAAFDDELLQMFLMMMRVTGVPARTIARARFRASTEPRKRVSALTGFNR